MKKVININFHGSVIPIEETSYELLQQYVESLRLYFAKEEGREEIINDIESRISELFNERLKAGATCITDADVEAIIKSIGRPQDLEEAELSGDDKEEQESYSSSQSFFTYNNHKKLYRDESNKVLGGVCSGIAAYFNIDPVIVRILFVVFGFTGAGILLYIILWALVPGSINLQNGVRKRLFRNPTDKIIGGVCSGLGSYFNVNPWIFRILFLLPVFSFFSHWFIVSFGPGTFIIYIILWLVIPEALTTSEKLEMKGEKVDINSIKNSVLSEMKDVSSRMGKFGKEAGDVAAQKGAQMGKEMKYTAMNTGGKAGDIILTLFKIFLYFVLGCIGLAIIIGLFALAVVAVGMFPLKDYILADGLQNILAWGTLIFFIGVPVVGIITFIIRRIARMRSSKTMRYSFLALWFLGIISCGWLVVSVVNDFKSINNLREHTTALQSSGINKLVVSPEGNYNINSNWFDFEPFSGFALEDTVYVNNISLRIKKSPTTNFEVGIIKAANGRNRQEANQNAGRIPFSVHQQDSVLFMNRAIAINKTDNFRNQNVQVIIYVPVGRQIEIENKFENGRRVWFGTMRRLNWRNWNDDEEGFDFDYGTTYIMKEDGLYTLEGKRWNDFDDNWGSDDNSDFSGQQQQMMDSLKNIQEKELNNMKNYMDSIRQLQQLEKERLKDSLQKQADDLNRKIKSLQSLPVENALRLTGFMMNI